MIIGLFIALGYFGIGFAALAAGLTLGQFSAVLIVHTIAAFLLVWVTYRVVSDSFEKERQIRISDEERERLSGYYKMAREMNIGPCSAHAIDQERAEKEGATS